MSELREIRVQTDPAEETRIETYQGREYLVAPVVMLCEGVLQGANASEPELCTKDVLEAFSVQWNGRPVVMNHPQIKGNYVSANEPSVLESWAFGFVFNTYVDDSKLKAEAWIDTARAAELGGDFQDAIDRIQSGEVVEVSTGLFADMLPAKGRFNNQEYRAIWTNVISDHLAILSAGAIGACSVENGCGIPRINSKDGPWGQRDPDMRINTAALRTIQPLEDSGTHCCETCKGAAMPKPKTQTQTTEEEPTTGGVTEVEYVEPTEEELVVLQNRAALVVNSIPDTITFEDSRKLVQAALSKHLSKGHVYIYAATSNVVVYEEYTCGYGCGSGCGCGSSRYALFQLGYSINEANEVSFVGEPQEVVLLTKITPVVNVTEGAQSQDSGTLSIQQEGDIMADGGQPKATGTTVPATPQVHENAQTEQTAAPAPAQAQAEQQNEPKAHATPVTVDTWLAGAPPEVAAAIRTQMSIANKAKTDVIAAIKANSANKMTDDQLNALDTSVLQQMAELAAVPAPQESLSVNYGGRGGLLPGAAVLSDEDKQRVNADTNKFGGAVAPKVFGSSEDFGHRVGSFRKH